jgi:hypothetical protein
VASGVPSSRRLRRAARRKLGIPAHTPFWRSIALFPFPTTVETARSPVTSFIVAMRPRIGSTPATKPTTASGRPT